MTDLESGFWQAYKKFLKIPLATEMPNPQTVNLSRLAQTDLKAAYDCLQKLDLQAMDCVLKKPRVCAKYHECFNRVLQGSGRIFLVGCGASGRIAAQIEYWSDLDKKLHGKIQAVLAGGDIALIEAIESCEDNPDFARAQMQKLNLRDEDLVIGLSASGEAPFILAALKFAHEHTRNQPLLICANSREALLARQSESFLRADLYNTVVLEVGEMALTGSTRMQATTAMTLFLLLALMPAQFNDKKCRGWYAGLKYDELIPFTVWEAAQYEAGRRVTYVTQSALALPVLADLTERSPTFNLPRLHHQGDARDESLFGLSLADTKDSADALQKTLGRVPNALEFAAFPKTRRTYLQGFDLSKVQSKNVFEIHFDSKTLDFRVDKKCSAEFDVTELTLTEVQFLLRLMLVNHSTLVMGRLSFYEGNLMTFLKPANFKLIDRAIRYAQFLIQQKEAEKPEYEEVATTLLKILPELNPRESIVLKVVEAITGKTS